MEEFKGIKVGDTIKVLKSPLTWSSALSKEYPLDNKFPHILTVKKLSSELGFVAMLCDGGYGWCLDSIIENGHAVLLTNENPTYEVY